MPGDRIPYLRVSCTYEGDTEKAVLIGYEGEEFWIGRSRIHGADDRLIDDFSPGQEIELRIEEWICEKNGFRGVPCR